jgi:hypothetical protein
MKQKLLSILFFMVTIYGFTKPIEVELQPSTKFITTWQTTNDNESITIPWDGISINIDWGDGTY